MREGLQPGEAVWACGEVSCVGVHGANRLASNSLLDAMVFGARVGRDLAREVRRLPPAKALVGRHDDLLDDQSTEDGAHAEIRREIRDLMWKEVGLVRTGDGLRHAVHGLRGLARRLGPGSSETHNLLTVAGLVTQAAYARRDSRGLRAMVFSKRSIAASAFFSWRRVMPQLKTISSSCGANS